MKKNNYIHRSPSVLSLTDLAFILLLVYLMKSGIYYHGENEEYFKQYQPSLNLKDKYLTIFVNNDYICFYDMDTQPEKLKINSIDRNNTYELDKKIISHINEILKNKNPDFNDIALKISNNTEYWLPMRIMEILNSE